MVNGVSTQLDYVYDEDGRLTRVDRNGALAEQYAYDLNGNRTSRQVGIVSEAATYDQQDRLTSLGATTYVFNADGMLSARGGDSFTYGARGELLSATVGGTTATYRYDGMGRRVSRTVGGGTTQYLYGDADPFLVSAVREPGGELTRLFYDQQGLLHALERGGTRYLVEATRSALHTSWRTRAARSLSRSTTTRSEA